MLTLLRLLPVFLLCPLLSVAQVPERWTSLAKEVERAGGLIEFENGQPVAIELDNGNNPLKGRGGKNEAVNDAWLEHALALLARMPALEELRIGAASGITDAGLAHFIGCKPLRRLNLSHLKGLTDAGISRLATARPDLEVVVE